MNSNVTEYTGAHVLVAGLALPENIAKLAYEQIRQNQNAKKTLCTLLQNFVTQIEQLQNKPNVDWVQVYKLWSKINEDIFGVAPTSLGVLIQDKTQPKSTYEFFIVDDEAKALQSFQTQGKEAAAGIKACLAKKESITIQKAITNALTKHWEKMWESFTTEKPTKDELTEVIARLKAKKNTKQLKRYRAALKAAPNNDPYYDQLWDGVPTPSIPLGRMQEVFYAHLGHKHNQILQINTMQTWQRGLRWKDDPFDVERKRAGTSFLLKLYESKTENDPYSGGGDIVIINENHEVILNIQLKASMISQGGAATRASKYATTNFGTPLSTSNSVGGAVKISVIQTWAQRLLKYFQQATGGWEQLVQPQGNIQGPLVSHVMGPIKNTRNLEEFVEVASAKVINNLANETINTELLKDIYELEKCSKYNKIV